MNDSSIARLKVLLEDVQPTVMRSIEVPLSIRLNDLHLLLQAAMGWSNSHLYEIVAGNLSWGFVDPDSDTSRLDAQNAQLRDLLPYSNVFTYLYDFGDGWEHTITVEYLVDPAPDVLYPRLVKVEGRCPPEDVGGPGRYTIFRQAIADPSHVLHRQYKDWIAPDFDPNIVDSGRLMDNVRTLAKRWSR
jgi:hypothetical protein